MKKVMIVGGLLLTTLLTQRVSAANGPKIKHVLVISIDGMHSQDLAKWIALNPNSTLAKLTTNGINYPNAFTTQPSDSIPATVGIFSGASPSLAGMYYDDAWHRVWAPPASKGSCTPGVANGTAIDLKEGIDINSADINGGGGVDPNKLPRDPFNNCSPIYPHDMIRVNTIFEIVKAAGMYTAYSEKRPSYDFLNGPSGAGVQDLYTPEIATANLLVPSQIQAFDQLRVNSILNEINELNHDGTQHAPKPALFGMNFQSVNSAKKSSASSGYVDSAGNFDSTLITAISYVDTSLGSIVAAMATQGLTNSTAIVITAKHGESPVANTRTIVSTSAIANTLTTAIPTNKITQKTSGLIWLKDQTQTAAAVTALATLPNVSQRLSFGAGLPFPDPTVDPAPPDVVTVMNPDVNFEPAGSATHAEHGGFGPNETHVPLVVYFPGWSAATSSTLVSTRQIAPTVLSLLGLDPNALIAVQQEHVTGLGEVLANLQ